MLCAENLADPACSFSWCCYCVCAVFLFLQKADSVVFVSYEGSFIPYKQGAVSSGRMELRQSNRRPAFLQIDLLTANLMLGASASGKYAAIIQFPLLLRSLAGTVASLFAPIMTSYYSKGDMEGLMNYANKAVRLNGLLLALPAALLGGLAGPFLTIWLGPSFSTIAPLLFIHAGYLVVSLAFMPLFYIWTAFNQQKHRRLLPCC